MISGAGEVCKIEETGVQEHLEGILRPVYNRIVDMANVYEVFSRKKFL